MPSWRTHVTAGAILLVLLVLVCFYLELSFLFITQEQIKYFFCLHIAFIFVLGSLLPDFDYPYTRIRHSIGPVVAGFLFISYVYLNRSNLFIINPISLLFMLIILIIILFMLGLVIPFRHHGKMHSMTAAIIYALTWVVLELVVFDMSILQASVIGVFGFMGYFSHLALDLDFKWL